jgi:hypothetical protein
VAGGARLCPVRRQAWVEEQSLTQRHDITGRLGRILGQGGGAIAKQQQPGNQCQDGERPNCLFHDVLLFFTSHFDDLNVERNMFYPASMNKARLSLLSASLDQELWLADFFFCLSSTSIQECIVLNKGQYVIYNLRFIPSSASLTGAGS